MLASKENVCAECGGEWDTDPAAKCYFPPWGKPQRRPQPLPAQPCLSGQPSCVTIVWVQPHPVPGSRAGERWLLCECSLGGDRGVDEKGGESVVCLFPPGVWGGVGAVGGAAGPSCPQLPRGSDAQAHCSACVWDSRPYFPTETKLKWEVGSLPGPKEPDSANSNTASEDPAHSLPLSVTGRGAGRS